MSELRLSVEQTVDPSLRLNMSLVFLLAYQTSMVSVEGLAKLVDPSQLTDDFEGSLDYNHEEWMELRVSLEEFMSNAVHLLSRLEDLQVGRGLTNEWWIQGKVD